MKLFWEKHPAFYYGLILFLGTLFALQSAWVLLPFFMLLHKKRLLQASLLFLLPCCLLYQSYYFPKKEERVEGIFYISSLKKVEKFGGRWRYEGVLATQLGRIPCRSFSKSYFNPNFTYTLCGKIGKKQGSLFALKIAEPWKAQNKRFSLISLRQHAQTAVKNYIKANYPHTSSARFLTGMLIGDLDDLTLLNAFNALGLSHLMAISGLHFSLLALLFHLFFRLFLPYKLEALLLILLMSCYFLFVGESPSVFRAWISSLLFLLGQLLEKRSRALNSLGVALLVSLLWNPLWATSLSLQLSFLATGGILFFYGPCNELLMRLLPKQALSEVITKKFPHQHLYILSSFFREACALTLAVHLALLPLLFSAFHYFSFNTLVYNLFFPLLASGALLLFLVSLPFGSWGHFLNSYYCHWILKITDSPPLLFQSFYIEQIPTWLLTLWLTALLVLAKYSRLNSREEKQMLI